MNNVVSNSIIRIYKFSTKFNEIDIGIIPYGKNETIKNC